MGDLVKNLVVWTIIAVVIMSLFSGVGGRNATSQEFNYTILCNRSRLDKLKKLRYQERNHRYFKSGETL